jgi:hypothetical protein
MKTRVIQDDPDPVRPDGTGAAPADSQLSPPGGEPTAPTEPTDPDTQGSDR